MDDYDVAVVGGGPIGCFVAERLASKGMHIAVFEEHQNIGEPVHCAGIVTQRVFAITNCPSETSEKIVQNTISGAVIHSPTGTNLVIGGDKTHGLVIKRQLFDEHLAEKAKKAGARLSLQTKVISAKKRHNHVESTIQHNRHHMTFCCKLLIGADGAHSQIRDTFRFPKPQETLQGIGAELSDTALDPQFVHIFVGHKIAPGFFAWIIPTNLKGTSARIGLCIGKHSNHTLQYYFTTLLQQPLLHGTTIIRRFGGTIPVGPLKKTVADHIMLVGDAAAQVKPTSGGGLYPGLLCAAHCSTIADEAFQIGHFNEKFLQRYHIRWTKDLGRELSLGMRFRNIFSKFSDAQFNKYLEKLNTKKTIDVINTYGDIDYPSRLILPLIKAMPSLLSLTPSMLKHTIK
ncbi:hypothetical protein AYK25_04870 [Thermoplasmatales archaeon SM1-50]|nr:MAG: hypothetical protein AYK25_04870 [Thermoplasmatales archaeon SM1-50]